jgi:hypothetical protein
MQNTSCGNEGFIFPHRVADYLEAQNGQIKSNWIPSLNVGPGILFFSKSNYTKREEMKKII